jgi:hypothetical protein
MSQSYYHITFVLFSKNLVVLSCAFYKVNVSDSIPFDLPKSLNPGLLCKPDEPDSLSFMLYDMVKICSQKRYMILLPKDICKKPRE